MVKQTAGRSDDELRAIAKGAELAVDGCAAVNGSGLESLHFRAEAMDFFTDLDCEFAGRAEDKHLWVSKFDVELRKRREGESSGFSRSRGR